MLWKTRAYLLIIAKIVGLIIVLAHSEAVFGGNIFKRTCLLGFDRDGSCKLPAHSHRTPNKIECDQNYTPVVNWLGILTDCRFSCPKDTKCENSRIVGCTGKRTFLDGSQCKLCPANATCDGSTTITCANTYQLNSTAHRCDQPISSCGTGTYLSQGICTPCPAGRVCKDGILTGDCLEQYYLWDNNRLCAECPSHTICSNSKISGCKDTYYFSPVGNCAECPAHNICTNAKITSCEKGYFLNGQCTPCSNGDTCEGGKYTACGSGRKKIYPAGIPDGMCDTDPNPPPPPCPPVFDCSKGTPLSRPSVQCYAPTSRTGVYPETPYTQAVDDCRTFCKSHPAPPGTAPADIPPCRLRSPNEELPIP